MQSFRNLSNNIFFKIFLAFIAISFVLFGVSGFILSGPNTWVAKVGKESISQNAFLRELQKNRNLIAQANQSEEATKYLESDQFKNDVVNRMVNDIIVSKLSDDLGVHADKELILKEIAKNPDLKGLDGKFDREAFQKLLKKNGTNEEQYVKLAQNEVVASMVMQTLTMTAPANENFAIAQEKYKQQKRVADVITITKKDIKRVATPKPAEISAYYEKNKQKYAAPEMRQVSYLTFSRNSLAKGITVTDEEVKAEYETNQKRFLKPETRDLYHLSFNTKEEADSFFNDLKAEKNTKNIQSTFAKLAYKLQKKKEKEITLNGVSKKDLMPELASTIFKLNSNEISTPTKSPLGFHVFLLNNITESGVVDFADIKQDLKTSLLEAKKNKIAQEKIAEIDDIILASNSLQKAADKLSLTLSKAVTISVEGKNKKGSQVSSIKPLDNFAKNAFALSKGESSKIFYSQSSDTFYALKVQEIDKAHDKELAEVKSLVTADLINQIQMEKMEELAKKVWDEIQKDLSKARQIAAKYRLSIKKNQEFGRTLYLNYQGRQIPYASPFLKELFTLDVGQSTGAIAQARDELTIGVLKSIKTPTLDQSQIDRAVQAENQSFRNEIAQSFNASLMKRHPVEVNKEFFTKKEQ